MNKIVHYETNVSMHLSHDGLREVARKAGVKLDALQTGEFVLFTNRAFTAFKIFGSGNTFAYHRQRDDRALDPRALLKTVAQFDGVRFDYRAALAESLFERLSPDVRRAIERDRARRDAPPAPVQKAAKSATKARSPRRRQTKKKGT